IRVVNVVDLMKLQPAGEHPHGLSHQDFDALFTTDKPIIFAFHGYPWLIHRLPKLGARAAYAKQAIRDKLIEHKEYICRHGDDMPEISGWTWGQAVAAAPAQSTEA